MLDFFFRASSNDDSRKKRTLGLCFLAIFSLALLLISSSSGLMQSTLNSVSGASPWSNFPGQEAAKNTYNDTLGKYWYGGACATTTNQSLSSLANTGARTVIQVKSQYVKGFLAFWISESFSGNIWAQVGYYIYQGSTPVGFFQVWNLTTRSEISSGTSALTNGEHSFSFVLSPGGVISFYIDGNTIGSFHSSAQVVESDDASYPICSLSEEGYSSSTFSFSPVEFRVAIQVLAAGSWQSAPGATSFGNSFWGVEGQLQNSTLASNEIVVGGVTLAGSSPPQQLWD